MNCTGIRTSSSDHYCHTPVSYLSVSSPSICNTWYSIYSKNGGIVSSTPSLYLPPALSVFQLGTKTRKQTKRLRGIMEMSLSRISIPK